MNYNEAYDFIFNEIGDDGAYLLDYIANDKMNEAINLIQKLTKCSINDAKAIWVDLKNEYGNETTNPFMEKCNLSPQEQAHNNAVAQELLNKPHCPICNSTNLSKITTTHKVAKIAAFGIFGMGDNGKTWKCNNCGSRF